MDKNFAVVMCALVESTLDLKGAWGGSYAASTKNSAICRCDFVDIFFLSTAWFLQFFLILLGSFAPKNVSGNILLMERPVFLNLHADVLFFTEYQT